ncbi:MAG: DUF2313 domain-containing protein [Ruminococcus sp.]|nr:DUF2313 domain-containing protein [Ruminococcus sp.]
MSVLEKLIRAHTPLKIYSIKEGSNLSFELSAYAAGLELVQKELETLEREAFAGSAEGYGLSLWEKLWGAPRDDLSTAKRREMLLARLSFGYGDFTLEGMRKVLSFLGIEGEIREYPNVFRVTVEVSLENVPRGQRKWIVSQLGAVFPAHIEADAVFKGFDWNDSDSRSLTFDSMEGKAMPWSEIDIYVS